jgi:DNA polymerase
MTLFIDIETFSSVDLLSCGAYKYAASPDFEILMIAFAVGGNPVQVLDMKDPLVDLRKYDKLISVMSDPETIIVAQNAQFERVCFAALGIEPPLSNWRCTAVMAMYNGLPGNLGKISKVLQLGDLGKLDTGKALIRFFCIPCKPTKVNGGRTRNMPEHDLEKWVEFMTYCVNDVAAEREIYNILKENDLPKEELAYYITDQKINSQGLRVDVDFVKNIISLNEQHQEALLNRMKNLTGVENPKSPTQLKTWFTNRTGKTINSLDKESVEYLLLVHSEDSDLVEVLTLRQQTSKSSIAKYSKMLDVAGDDGKIRGAFQFYGAGRTGRWAGRGVQPHNLKRNNMKDIDVARDICSKDYGTAAMVYGDALPSTLSELVRTSFIPDEGNKFVVSDYSSIEARVLAWLAGEAWKLEVFETHGKIYEAAASMMFGVPIDEVDSKLRQRGKVAELALGYQGGVGALVQMGAERMGMNQEEMQYLVNDWRRANPRIKKLWSTLEKMAVASILEPNTPYQLKDKGLKMVAKEVCGAMYLLVQLPSGRVLSYRNAALEPSVKFKGTYNIMYSDIDMDKTFQWNTVDTYGGKLTENIVQAIARDILADAIERFHEAGYAVPLHVHDEVILEVPEAEADEALEKAIELMRIKPMWAEGIPLNAAGFTTAFYKKD